MKHWKFRSTLVLPQAASTYILKNLHFFGFLASLTLVYISIVHRGQDRVREYQSLQKEVKELRSHYLKMRSDAIVHHQQSQIVDHLKDFDLKLNGSLPQVIERP